MPLLPTTRYVYLKRDEFVKGMLSANPGLKPPPLFHLDFLRLRDISSKALTDMVHGEYPEKTRYRRIIDNFFLLPFSTQSQLLQNLGVYVFPTPSNNKVAPEKEAEEDASDDDPGIPDATDNGDTGDEGDDQGDVGEMPSDIDMGFNADSEDFDDDESKPVDPLLGKNHCLPKRRRVMYELPKHLATEFSAVIPQKIAHCRLLREYGIPLYSVNWKNRKDKPLRLYKLDGSGLRDKEKSLTAVAWRENGMVYYAPTAALKISSYRWLLLNKPTLEGFYARVQLLITPTTM